MTQLQAINLAPKVFNIKGWIKQTNAEVLKETFDTLLNRSNFKVLKYLDHQFPLNAMTALWLLAESHLAIHTFSGSGWSYIELSSCNREKALTFISLCESLDAEFSRAGEMEELNCNVSSQ